jgi:hypothetical protein
MRQYFSINNMKRLIKNYTVDIPVERTIMEIQKNLSAKRRMRDCAGIWRNWYNPRFFFKTKLNNKELPFRLLAKAERVYQASWGENSEGWKQQAECSPGEFVKPDLRHRLPLSIWSRQN